MSPKRLLYFEKPPCTRQTSFLLYRIDLLVVP